MRDEAATQITETAPSPLELRTTAATRVKLQPLQKLTRAHLSVDTRVGAVEAMREANARIAEKLGAQLKTTLTCKATLQSATLHPFSHLAARALFVLLELGGESLAVFELDALGVGALLSRITGNNEPAGLPARLASIEEAALGWVVLSALAELRAEPALAAFSPRLVSLTLDRGEVLQQLDARRRHLAVQLELKLGETSALGRLLVPALWLQAKFDALATEAAPPAREEVLAATLPATCLIGSALLNPTDVAQLAVGDVLFVGVTQHAEGLAGPGRLLTPSFELRGAFSEAGFTLTRAFERPTQEHPMSQSVDPSVPVEVEVELTRLRLPLHQLGTLRPGAVLPLHLNAAQQVVVRIGDKAVARAELVEIEGEIGARIVAML
ncbi:MAG: FliM/FliN family flagellar motor switch protein [Myxococcota bacterium]